jgi:pantoate--beta-alanine ligase
MTGVVRTPGALRETCDAWRARGERVGLVPTMGALHQGHMSLIDAARARGATRIVLTIFVNPMQFGPREDLARYPRTFDADLALCAERAVDVVYAPDATAMYPPDFQTHVEVEHLTQGLEGTERPTHFRGVTTVVAKLFHATGPCLACFGRKDYQQLRVVAAMARDLDMPVDVIECPIVREPDGLALSSRNRYLAPGERARATVLVRGLRVADAAWRAGERAGQALERLAREEMERGVDQVDYCVLADAERLDRVCGNAEGRVVLLVAGRIGCTRLLDNAVLGEAW